MIEVIATLKLTYKRSDFYVSKEYLQVEMYCVENDYIRK